MIAVAPGTRAGAERRILVLRQVRRAEVDGVQVDRRLPPWNAPQTVVAVVADVRDVERRRPWQRHLHAGLPLHRGRNLRVVLERDQRRNAHGAEAGARASAAGRCADPATSRSAGCRESRTPCCRPAGRRTARRRRGTPSSGCRTGRRPRRSAARATSVGHMYDVFGDAVTRLADAVVQVAGAGHDGADRGRRIRRAGRGQDLAGTRIDRVARVARADHRAVAAAGHVQQRRSPADH